MNTLWSRTPRTRLFAIVLIATTVPGVGAADYLSGRDTTFEAFYLVPVMLAAWYLGRRSAIAVGALCVASGLVANFFLPGPQSARLATEIWNAASRSAIYVVTAILLTSLQRTLDARTRLIGELETALGEIRTLRGLLPMCAWCKRIRDEQDGSQWKTVERYVAEHSEAEFTHGICPDCAAKMVKDAEAARRGR